jgi:antitoxin VapB
MAQARAKIVTEDDSQVVRLPREFHLPGEEVRVSRKGDAVILEPIEETKEQRHAEVSTWFARMDALGPLDGFEGDWREQPPLSDDDEPRFD